MRRHVWFALCLLIGVLGVTSCQTAVSPAPTPLVPSPLRLPTPTIRPLIPTATPDTGWVSVGEGMELREMRVLNENGRLRDQILLLRLDPSQYRFDIGYQPGTPLTLAQWQLQTDALLVVNGGFFTPEFIATGLIIIDGVASGSSYGANAGMFAITDAGPQVISLAERPYAPDPALIDALQAFPMLVQPGGVVGYTEPGEANRRTVVAQDQNGRLLFIIAPLGGFTLADLSEWLVATADLGIDRALNLDGGTSTGLFLAEPETRVPVFTAVPTVILVYPAE